MTLPTHIYWYGGAILSGTAFAFLIVSVFQRCAPKGSSAQYWTRIGHEIRGLFYGDEDHFWSHYGSIIQQTAKYVSRQLLGVVLAFAPLIIVFLTLSPWLYQKWDQNAGWAVFPSTAGVLTGAESSTGLDDNRPKILTLDNGHLVDIPPTPGSYAICQPHRFACLVLQGFGFKAIVVDGSLSGISSPVIVRSTHNDWNPLWPYLSDPEFLLFVSLMFSSILFMVWNKGDATRTGAGYSVGFVDYLFMQLATHNIRSMNKLGDWETRINSARLSRIAITRPIFIAGLARSGTTILLEKIASVTGVATHRYRDFPFIMTPIVWNRFISILGARQDPTERPHQDGIRITRDSPDAFEEPIWQYYFPHLHDPSKNHALNADFAGSDFATFYRQHIQKILLIRKGSRYLSKGNYNLPRIKYIRHIFPDVAFLITIRHPLTHIASLERQHSLFIEYAKADDKIPEYLRAVGHYEFGPQRIPICLTDTGCRDITAAWTNGDDILGYALQWNDVYRYVANLLKDDTELSKQIRIIRFEDMCADPEQVFRNILHFSELDTMARPSDLAHGIQAPSYSIDFESPKHDACWQATANVASLFGYARNPKDSQSFSSFS